MKALITIMTFVFTLTLSTIFGQAIPNRIQLDKFRKEFINKTLEFDSILLIDKTSFWYNDKKMNGFGFKNNEIYKVTLFLEKHNSSFYDIKIRKIKKSKVTDSLKIEIIKKTDYLSIEKFSIDSLNLKSRTNSYIEISDQNEWTILIIKINYFIIKQSYAPEFYQNIAPTRERQVFMDTLIKLDLLLK